MAIEAATSIASLVPAYPGYLDEKKEGDDHIRLLKSVLQACFPAVGGQLGRAVSKSGAFSPSATTENFVIFECTGDLICTLPTSSLTNGLQFGFKVAAGGCVQVMDGSTSLALFVSGDFAVVRYDGAAWKFEILNQREASGTFVETPLSLSAEQYVLAHGGTIGSNSSSATFTGARYKRLFSLLWAVSQLELQNSGGGAVIRSADWSTDWNIARRLVLPDGRGRVLAGIDSGAGRLVSYVPGTLLAAGGSEYLMSHTHAASSATALTPHSHSFAASDNFNTSSVSVDHSHGVSITSQNENATHYHGISLLTGNENAEHTHGGVPPTNFGASNFSAGSTLAGASGGTVSTGAQQANHQHAVSGNSGTESSNHQHVVSGTTALMSASITATHSHITTVSLSGTSGTADQAHSHTVTIVAEGAGSQGNVQPTLMVNRYLRL
jgi:hypothetical protein